MNLQAPCRNPSPSTKSCAREWGRLGRPTGDAACASLLHVISTPVATLRHAFYRSGTTIPAYRGGCDTLLYWAGGPGVKPDDNPLGNRRLVFCPRGHRHPIELRGPAHVLAIEIVPRAQDLKAATWPGGALPLPATIYAHIWGVMLQVADQAPAEGLAAAILDLLNKVTDITKAVTPTCVANAANRIHMRWCEVPSARRLASLAGVTPQYLCRAFRKAAGVTMRQYALLVRLDHARGLLWGTDLPIADIAALTGFADQSHLTRALTACTARTPLRLRWSAPCTESVQEMMRLFSSHASPTVQL